MLLELSVSTVMVLATVGIHAAGLWTLRHVTTLRRVGSSAPLVTLAVVLGLFVLHGVEIWLYAAVFTAVGAVPDLREAVYFSTISYGAIGYGDSGVAAPWKLVGAIEGINGAILLGWSVAFFVNVIARYFRPPRRRRSSALPGGDAGQHG